jgi:hypothetical protein
VTRDLEDAEIKETAVWRFAGGEPLATADGKAAI